MDRQKYQKMMRGAGQLDYETLDEAHGDNAS